MKKQLLTILSIATAASAFAQLPVSTSPQNRKVVLEEFTGIHCGYCPDGHYRADLLKAANPSNVILVNIHSGSFANAAVGEPDFKTTEGTAIDAMTGMNIAGYPAGTVNRVNFGSTLTPSYAQQTVSPWGMAQSRGTWSVTATNSILTQSSYVNVALQGSLNVTTRVLNVEVQVYYTANSPVGTNSLTVMLLENKIANAVQSNYGSPLYNISNYNPDGTYNHNHVLRKVLTAGNFGMSVSPTTAGSTFTTMLTYTVPATYGAAGKTTAAMLGNLELAAFITESDRPVISGANGPVMLTGFTSSLDIATTNLTTDAGVCSGLNFGSSFKFTNNGSSTVTTAVFSYAMNGGAVANYTYSGAAVNPMTSSPTITLQVNSFTAQATNTLNINVVSVNGGTDQVVVNNPISGTAPLTTVTANYLNMQMDFTQDRYGSESSWKVYDEISNAIITQDGPYTDLGSNGTLLHVKTFTINSNTCYKLVVSDSYGDGINAGFGAGGYVLKSGGIGMITSPGTYGSGETKLYKSSIAAGVASSVKNVESINLYPNPASGVTNLSINLTQNETVNITVLNTLGQEVFTSKSNNFNAGENNVTINTENWAAGTYFINVSTSKGSSNQKLNVIK